MTQTSTRFTQGAEPTGPSAGRRKAIVVMDAGCALCSSVARWIARRDVRDEVRILPLQTPLGRELARANGVDAEDPESWLLIDENGRVWRDLDAAIALGARLGGVARLLGVLRLAPGGLRRWIYRRVARNRYRLFGDGDLCATPDPELRRRLIGTDSG